MAHLLSQDWRVRLGLGMTGLFGYCFYRYIQSRYYRTNDWFKNKNVLITGGAGGLGVEMTKRFKALGCNVILWDIGKQRLEEVMREHGVHGYVVDLTDMTNVEQAIRETLEKHGSIDVLINNAGLVAGKSLLEMSNADVDRVMTVNTTSHMWTIKGFLPKMLENKDGHIVTIASVMGAFGASKLVEYSASKAGAMMMADALRLELTGTGVESTTIMPWHIKTPMFVGLKMPWYVNLVAPTLEIEDVADRVVDAVRKKQAITIIPKIFWAVYLMRAIFPVWLFDAVARYGGAVGAMNTFVGRKAL